MGCSPWGHTEWGTTEHAYMNCEQNAATKEGSRLNIRKCPDDSMMASPSLLEVPTGLCENEGPFEAVRRP